MNPARGRTRTYHLRSLRSSILESSSGQEDLDLAGLEARLASFRTRPPDVGFIHGGKDLAFRDVARVLDLSKGAGVRPIGLMTN